MQILLANISTIAAGVAGFGFAGWFGASNEAQLLWAMGAYSFTWNACYSLKV